ncbi:hypothetical protein RND71_018023 [Anisodus tanguticus]|uniref:U3 small nucleolar RNA-associated protein 13 C-terminal domain-containing protein n=1 Tax=Anisodus tanguticus TaxID=243964 RepID=A0AAE1VBP1_9SOLA|nr:hypothetical protein RND71_018023 [Anisodus tanguticus]
MVQMLLCHDFYLTSKLFPRKGDAGDQIGKALNALAEEEFRLLGEYVREWNTKPKSCHIAQFVLSRVLRLPPTKILEARGMAEIFEGLIPHTQRHFNRLVGLETSTCLLDFTLTQMLVIEPEGNEGKLEYKDAKLSNVADC